MTQEKKQLTVEDEIDIFDQLSLEDCFDEFQARKARKNVVCLACQEPLEDYHILICQDCLDSETEEFYSLAQNLDSYNT